MRILITRPLADAEKTARRLILLGHEPILSPVSRLEILSPALTLSPAPDALIITSRNTVRALARHPQRAELHALPVLAVGHSTAQLARQHGFCDITTAEGTAASLVKLIVRQCASGAHLLYLAGRDRAADIASALTAHGITTETREVYAAVAEPDLDDRAASLIETRSIDAVLHYSARGAALFLQHINRSQALQEGARHCAHLCFSAQVATALKPLGVQTVLIAQRPDEDSLMDLLPSLARLNRDE